MTGVGDRAREQAVQQCLRQMDALARELRKAMGAIAANSLPSFEASLPAQREGVAKVSAALAQVEDAASKPANVAGPAELDGRLRVAARELLKLNEQYSALLEHAGRSMRMLSALYGRAPAASNGLRLAAGGEQSQTWSWKG